MKNTKKNWLKYLPTMILLVLGIVGGYCYYYFVGCASGSCAISSSPWISMLFGGAIGGLIGSILTPASCKCCARTNEDEDNEQKPEH